MKRYNLRSTTLFQISSQLRHWSDSKWEILLLVQNGQCKGMQVPDKDEIWQFVHTEL